MTSLPEQPTVLVSGKDARTDVMIATLAASPHAPEIHTMTEFNSPGMRSRSAEVHVVPSLMELPSMLDVIRKVQPDLVVIGPEEPLSVGLADAVQDELGIPAFGPRQSLARIETSKTWARELLGKYAIAGAVENRAFTSADGLADYLRELGEFVLKPDGLTGGKGVRLSGEHFESFDEAYDYALECIERGGVVSVEEKLDGEEFSLQTITDGSAVLHTPLVQDHKRAHDGDQGPNTGGMGSYSCADGSLPFLSRDDLTTARAINESVVKALRAETGHDYHGVLYGGFMATGSGVKLIEYNARFGDPEAMNVLSLLRGDFLELCWSVAHGELQPNKFGFDSRATVCNYVVPEGYPGAKDVGAPIAVHGADTFGEDTRLYWAAVNQRGSDVLLTGSRALAFVGIGADLDGARAAAAQGLRHVDGPVRFRTDIGTDQALARRTSHMQALRG